jgi:hypothetical protein
VSADNHRSSYSFRPRVELKLQALAKRWGVTPTRYMEMMIERAAFGADVTVTNADVIRYNDAKEREKQG